MDVTQIKEDYVVRNLYREARIMSKLCHPCIARLFQTMQYGNVYYLVTELVGGGDLCSFIKGQRYGKLEERPTRVYARQLVSAVSHMHNLGIVHRDLKMENVMLNQGQTQIKIVDFGLSNVFNGSNPLKTHCGSPEYAAPELFIAGKHYGPEIDLWSLGVILYGMVVGQLPFVSSREDHVSSQERRKRLLAQINRGLALPQRKAIATLSAEFRAMMSRLLIADPAKRITVQELLFHPWVTEKGKKIVRPNPIRPLGDNLHAKIFEEMSVRLQLDWESIRESINRDGQGNIAGVYHLMMHRQQMQLIDDDIVVKTVSSSPKHQSNLTRRDSAPPIKPPISSPSSENKQEKKKPEHAKSAPIRRTTVPDPNRPPSRASASRSAKVTTPKQKNLQTEASVNPKRIALSADKTVKKTSLLPTPRFWTNGPPEKAKSAPRERGKKAVPNINVKGKIVEAAEAVKPRLTIAAMADHHSLRVIGHKCDLVVESPCIAKDKKMSFPKNLSPDKVPKKTDNARICSAKSQIGRPTSESSAARRPQTGGPIHTAERAMKRRSALPVTTSQSAPTKNGSSHQPLRRSSARSALKANPLVWEKSPLSLGDSNNTPRVQGRFTMKPSRPLITDPIARCITGYIVNKVEPTLKGIALQKIPVRMNAEKYDT